MCIQLVIVPDFSGTSVANSELCGMKLYRRLTISPGGVLADRCQSNQDVVLFVRLKCNLTNAMNANCYSVLNSQHCGRVCICLFGRAGQLVYARTRAYFFHSPLVVLTLRQRTHTLEHNFYRQLAVIEEEY